MSIRTADLGLVVLAIFGIASISLGCKSSGNSSGDRPSEVTPSAGAPAPEESSAKPSSADTKVTWTGGIDVASGDAYSGPWRMNESEFHYVDDATVAMGSGGLTAVAWVDNRRQNIFFQLYGPEGNARLARPVNVSSSPEIFSWLPRMVITPDGNDVFVLWQEIVFSGGTHGGEAFFARSTDGGKSFSEPLNLSKTTAGCGKGRLTEERWDNGSLDIAMGPKGEIYAAWTEYQGPLRLARSLDGGETFSSPVHVSGTDSTPARGPSLAVADDGTLYIAWTVGEDPAADIRFAKSEDQGRTFDAAGVVAETKGHSDAPKLTVDDAGTVHLVHGESPSGPLKRYHVRYVRMTAGQESFGAPRSISGPHEPAEGANFPTIRIDGDDVLYVVWEHYPHAGKRPDGLGFTLSRDGGGSFESPTIVPGTGRELPGFNGSLQGLLSRKLDVNEAGDIGVVNSGFDPNQKSLIRLVRGRKK